VKLPANGFWDLSKDSYTGIWSVIWTGAGSGNMQVDELTA
jgi:hypothetical protein